MQIDDGLALGGVAQRDSPMGRKPRGRREDMSVAIAQDRKEDCFGQPIEQLSIEHEESVEYCALPVHGRHERTTAKTIARGFRGRKTVYANRKTHKRYCLCWWLNRFTSRVNDDYST
jgi:hypothetical protein